MNAAILPSVLVTRPEPGASETAQKLLKMGFAPVLAPCLHIRRLPARLPASGLVQAVLVTSGNAADTLPLSHHGLRLLAVGDATAARAEKAGFTDARSAAGDAQDLVELAARLLDPAGAALLLACGAGDGADIARALRRRGFRVQRRVLYAAEPAPSLPDSAVAALKSNDLHAATFFSAETAGYFVRLVIQAGLAPALGATTALAISPAVALALAELPWRTVLSASRPNQDELLALLT